MLLGLSHQTSAFIRQHAQDELGLPASSEDWFKDQKKVVEEEEEVKISFFLGK